MFRIGLILILIQFLATVSRHSFSPQVPSAGCHEGEAEGEEAMPGSDVAQGSLAPARVTVFVRFYVPALDMLLMLDIARYSRLAP